MQFMGMPNAVRIVKFLITETGTYNPQYRRPYHTEMDHGTLTAIQEKVASSNHITPQMLGGLADRFVMPSAAVEKEIVIPHGWNEKRLRFQLEVETTFGVGGTVTEIIQGYTDYFGVSMGGHISPQMEFHINSILKVRKIVENTPLGAKSYFNVVDSTHVLVDNSYTQLYQPNVTERMRPEDIFSAMSRETYSGIGSYVDNRTAVNNVPVLSNRKNGIPTNYLAEIMEGYQNAVIDPTDSTGTHIEHYSKAREFSASPSINLNAFIKAISNVRGMPSTSFFTFADLVKLDPNAANNTKFIKTGNAQINTVHQAGQTASWETPDQSTLAATVLGNSVPALLMELALTGIHFRSTNREIGGQPQTIIMDSQGFTDFDITNHLMSFRARFEREIMYGLTYCNQLDYAVEMKVDLLGETWIRVSMSSQPFVDYVQPSFADALAVPVMTNNREAVTSVVEDFSMFLNSVIPTRDDMGFGNSNNSQIFL